MVGNGRKFPGALIVPTPSSVQNLAREFGLTNASYAELLKHPKILDFYRQEVARLTPHLAQWEKIKNIALLENELTIESGELTPTLKVKRRIVDEKYKAEIDAIYDEKPGFGQLKPAGVRLAWAVAMTFRRQRMTFRRQRTCDYGS